MTASVTAEWVWYYTLLTWVVLEHYITRAGLWSSHAVNYKSSHAGSHMVKLSAVECLPHYDSAFYAVVMCLCMFMSVTRWYCIKTAKCRIMQTMPGTLVFLMPKISAKFEWSAKCRWGRSESTNNLLCNRHMVSVKAEYEFLCTLSYSYVGDDLEWPRTPKLPQFVHFALHFVSS